MADTQKTTAGEKAEVLPRPPFHPIEGLANFRDLGGYPLASAPGSGSGSGSASTTNTSTSGPQRIVRRNVVFRSSEPSHTTEAGVAALQTLDIAVVYDLRSSVEIARGAAGGQGWPVKEWDGARRDFVPVFLDQDYSPETLALRYANYAAEGYEGFVKAYMDILSAAVDPSNLYQPFKTILEHLSSPSASPPSPCLIHCTAGKDRTGVICALILSLCGVADDVVAHEYSLTDLGLKSRHSDFVTRIVNNPDLGMSAAGARRMVSAQKGSMLSTLARLREKHGSVEKCVVDLGLLSPEGIAQLRKNLIVDAGEDEVIPWQSHAELLVQA